MQIRKKLTLQFSFLAASILILFSIAVYFFYSLFRAQDFYERLESKANLLGKLLIVSNHVDENFFKRIRPRELITMVDEQEIIYDSHNERAFINSNLESFREQSKKLITEVRKKEKVEFKIEHLEALGYLYTDEAKNKDFIIFTAGYDYYGFTKLEKLRYILITGNVISILIVIGAGYFFSVSALMPISNIVAQVDNISVSNLNMRVRSKSKKDEIAQLAQTFNKLLDRVEFAFDLQRNFVSSASHELRTPLTSIYGSLEVTLINDISKEEMKQNIQSALEDLQKLIHLTNGLLNLARMTENRAELQIHSVRIDEIVLEAMAMQQSKYAKQTFDLSMDDNIVDLEQLCVKGNEHLLKIAVNNIIDNACKYSDYQKVIIHLSLEKSTDINYVCISVRDSGIGISQHEIHKITTPFYRGQNTERVAGFGIGLSLTHKIIQVHNGLIEAKSSIGEGSNVTIKLPVS